MHYDNIKLTFINARCKARHNWALAACRKFLEVFCPNKNMFAGPKNRQIRISYKGCSEKREYFEHLWNVVVLFQIATVVSDYLSIYKMLNRPYGALIIFQKLRH